jgi:hypothetical protein
MVAAVSMGVLVDIRKAGNGWELGDGALAFAAGVELVGRKFAVDLDGF